jgi:hypothetical protein
LIDCDFSIDGLNRVLSSIVENNEMIAFGFSGNSINGKSQSLLAKMIASSTSLQSLKCPSKLYDQYESFDESGNKYS